MATHNPESKPDCPDSARLVQGFEKLLCVAEWFACVNRNVTMSPTFAVMFDGSNASLPSAPTITMCSANVLFDAAAELVADADAVSETVTVVVTLTTATAVDVAAAE